MRKANGTPHEPHGDPQGICSTSIRFEGSCGKKFKITTQKISASQQKQLAGLALACCYRRWIQLLAAALITTRTQKKKRKKHIRFLGKLKIDWNQTHSSLNQQD